MNGEMHDLRNLLMIVLGQCDMAAKDLATDGGVITAERLEKIRAPAADCCLIIAGRFFSHDQLLSQGTFDLCTIAHKIERDMSELLAVGTGIYVDVPQDAPPIIVDGDSLTMYRLLLNLVLNAKETILKANRQEMGMIIMSVRSTAATATITILDNGCGLTREEMIDLGTSKQSDEEQHGHGFHLVREGVNQLHGLLAIRSEMQVGSAFAVTLPRHHEEAQMAEVLMKELTSDSSAREAVRAVAR